MTDNEYLYGGCVLCGCALGVRHTLNGESITNEQAAAWDFTGELYSSTYCPNEGDEVHRGPWVPIPLNRYGGGIG